MELNYCILVLIFHLITAHDMDYCEKPCKTPRTHTLCAYSEGPSAECIDYKPSPLSDEEQTRIVHRLNERRNYVAMGLHSKLPSASNMLQMFWVESLARSAQRWADQCIPYQVPDKNDVCRNLLSMPAGQIIATVPGPSPGLLVETMVDMWYIQAAYYQGNLSFYTAPPQDKTYFGGFTQMLWADTNLVGCGRAEFSTEYGGPYTRLVCNFAPEGNLPGGRVWIPGIPCNACPRQSKCSEEYHGLCMESDNADIETMMLENIKPFETASDEVENSESTTVVDEILNHEDDGSSLNVEQIMSDLEVTDKYPKNNTLENYGVNRNNINEIANIDVSTEVISVTTSPKTLKKSVKLFKAKKLHKRIIHEKEESKNGKVSITNSQDSSENSKDPSINEILAKASLIDDGSPPAREPKLKRGVFTPNSKIRRNSHEVKRETQDSGPVDESEDERHLRELFEGLTTSETTESDEFPPHATEAIDTDASSLTTFLKTIPIVKGLFKTKPGYLYEPGQPYESGPSAEGGAATIDSFLNIRSVFIASAVRYISL